ncbi:hypothetical protein PSHT_04523, partial [Puccinia striiformis]
MEVAGRDNSSSRSVACDWLQLLGCWIFNKQTMGVCLSSNSAHHQIDGNTSASRDRSYAIDRQIEEDAKKFKRECKILLLGSGESGKSTIVKQMKIIHQNGYTREELLLFKLTIYKNVIDSAQAVVVAMRKLKLDPVEDINQSYSDKILDYRLDFNQFGGGLNPEIVRSIESLWHDPIIPAGERILSDGFSGIVHRIGQMDYIPNEVDVLMARTKTTGISETNSTCSTSVGNAQKGRNGSIASRLSPLSEYDQVLLEESGQNRMAESLVLFESVINSRWFLRTSIILFLNKIDIFKAKLPKVPLERIFLNIRAVTTLTQATDTSNIRLVFAAVKET